MKKLILVLFLFAFSSTLKAQYTVEVETWAGDPSKDVWVYVGSLPASSSANLQKLKIEVFGGQYVNSNGETTYYVSNRDALTINQTRMGGTNGNQFTLRAFNTNNGGLDFYIYTQGNSYTAYSVRSTEVGGTGAFFNLTGNGSSQQLVQCTVQAIAPPGLPSSVSGTEHVLSINPFMITDAAGNIGINTFNPDSYYKLSVNGPIRAKEVKVETGWADYVFDKGYSLRPLKEVEDYIHQNQHLPDVPSAAEVQKNGVNIGETDALFLKKIEELTLYLIEMKKEIQALQKENDQQKKEIKQLKSK